MIAFRTRTNVVLLAHTKLYTSSYSFTCILKSCFEVASYMIHLNHTRSVPSTIAGKHPESPTHASLLPPA